MVDLPSALLGEEAISSASILLVLTIYKIQRSDTSCWNVCVHFYRWDHVLNTVKSDSKE